MKHLAIVIMLFSPTIAGATNYHHKILSDGENGAILPSAIFNSTVTQPIISISETQDVTFSTYTMQNGWFTLVGQSTITINHSGIYIINFNGSGYCSGGGGKEMMIWASVNGVARVAKTSLITTQSKTSDVSGSFVSQLNAGDTLPMRTWADDASCSWLFTDTRTGPLRPMINSVRLYIAKVGGIF